MRTGVSAGVAITDLIWMFIKTFGLPIVLIVIILICYKALVDYLRYGKRIFSAFEKKDISYIKEKTITTIMNRIDPNAKTIFPTTISTGLIGINKSGVYLIYIVEATGMLVGDINNTNLKNVEGAKDKGEITNPIPRILDDENYIKNLTGIEHVYKYIVLNNNAHLKVDINDKTIKVVPYRDVYVNLAKTLKKENLTEDEINRVFTTIDSVVKLRQE